MHQKPVSQNELVTNIKEAFSRTPVTTRKAVKAVNTLLAFITNNRLTDEQYKNIYFYILRGLNTEDVYLKSTLYSAMTQLKTHTSDSFIAINSLTKDLNSDTQHIIKAKALMALFSLIPQSMVNDFEKYVTQAFVSRFEPRRDSGVIISLLNVKDSKENVKRWTMNINLLQGVGIKDYHALALLSHTKDRNSLEKLCSDHKKFKGASGVAVVNILAHFARGDTLTYSEAFFKLLKSNDECVNLEAARVISHMEDPAIFMDTVISLLKNTFKSSKKAIKFATMRIASALACKSEKVKILNKEIEELVGHSNRTISMMAITTLLKTGTEDTIERLVALIPGIINDMSDSFKIIVLSALESLSMQYKSKETVFFEFIKNALNEKGTLTFKRHIVKVMERISDLNPSLNEKIISILSSYIEDSQNYLLTMDILALFSKLLVNVENYKKYLTHILNRLIIDNNHVKCSALQALFNITLTKKELRLQTTSILTKHADDEDEMISSESKLLLNSLKQGYGNTMQKFDINELGFLEESVIEFLGSDYVKVEKDEEHLVKTNALKVLKTCQEVSLTEKNSDFAFFVTKTIFSNLIMLKLRIVNMLENVSFKKGKLFLSIATNCKTYKTESNVNYFEKETIIEKCILVDQNFVNNPTYDGDNESICEHAVEISYESGAVVNGTFAYELFADQDENETEIESCSLLPFEINFIDFVTPFKVHDSNSFLEKNITLTIPGQVNEVRLKILNIFSLKVLFEEFEPIYQMSCSGIVDGNSMILYVKQDYLNTYNLVIKTDNDLILDKLVSMIC